MIHGLINFLVSDNAKAARLREQYEWWVLPIVNPDGVVIGNYRSNLQGKDMNRHFFQDNEVDESLCTEVELIRAYMKDNLADKK